MEADAVFHFKIKLNILTLYLNTFVMGLRPLEIFFFQYEDHLYTSESESLVI